MYCVVAVKRLQEPGGRIWVLYCLDQLCWLSMSCLMLETWSELSAKFQNLLCWVCCSWLPVPFYLLYRSCTFCCSCPFCCLIHITEKQRDLEVKLPTASDTCCWQTSFEVKGQHITVFLCAIKAHRIWQKSPGFLISILMVTEILYQWYFCTRDVKVGICFSSVFKCNKPFHGELLIRIYHWQWEEDCTAVVCEAVCCMEVRPGL